MLYNIDMSRKANAYAAMIQRVPTQENLLKIRRIRIAALDDASCSRTDASPHLSAC